MREAMQEIIDAYQRGLIYEEDLSADLSQEKYDLWFAQSKIVCGVRMGPKLE